MATVTKAVETKTAATATEADVHHMIRTVGNATTTDGMINVDQADEAIRTWLEKGYRLFTVVPLGEVDNKGVYGAKLLYILHKEG